MSFEDLIPYGKQDINRDDVLAVSKALKSDYLTTGPLVEEFEKSFSKFTGSILLSLAPMAPLLFAKHIAIE